MSWHFVFHARTKEAVGRALEDQNITGTQCPAPVLRAVQFAADEVWKSLAMNGPARMLSVSSGGHLDSWGGSATIEVKLVNAPLE